MKNILAGIDFSVESDSVIKHALHIAKAFKSKIWLLHVAAPDPDFVSFKAGPQSERDLRAEKLNKENKILNEYVSQIIDEGIESEALLIPGPTNEMIIEKSKKLEIDLIVLGHLEHGFLYNLFLGSTSKNIIEKSSIPVLVIPIGIG